MISNNFSIKDIQCKSCSLIQNASESFNINSINKFNMTLFFVESSRGSENLSITGCILLFVYCTMSSIILPGKKSLNNKDGFFTDLPARWGPGLFCTCSQLLFYGFVRLYLFSIPFLPFSWSQYIQNYAQLVVMHYHNYYHLQYHQEFWTFVSADLLQNFRIHLSSVIWSHLGQIPNFQKIILGQLLSNK